MAAPTLCPAGAWRLATICRPWAIRTVADRRRAVGMLPRAGSEAPRVKSGLSPLRNIHRVRIGCAKGASANALGRQHPIRSIAGCRLQRSDVDQSRWPVGRRRNLVVDRKSDAARPRQRHARLLGAALLVGPPLPRSSRPQRFRGPGNGGARLARRPPSCARAASKVHCAAHCGSSQRPTCVVGGTAIEKVSITGNCQLI